MRHSDNSEEAFSYDKYDKEELLNIIKVLESDLFKVRAENMKLQKQFKDLQDKSILNMQVSFKMIKLYRMTITLQARSLYLQSSKTNGKN